MTIISPSFPKSRWGRRLTAFWQGFVTPSRFAFGAMMAIFLAAALAACVVITPATLAGPMGAFLPRSTKDTEAFATREALQLSLDPVTDNASRLYVVSDSILAHVFASDAATAQALDEATDRPWRVAFLTTPLQGPLDEAALAEYATKQRPGVVVLSLGFDRFGLKQDDLVEQYRMARVGVRSDWADQAVASLGVEPARRTGIYMIDNRSFLERNVSVTAARMLVGRPAERRIDAYLLHPPLDAAALASQRAGILKHLRTPPQPDDVGIRLLTETVQRLKGNGNSIVFVENPLSDALFEGPSDRALYAAYLQRSKALAESMGFYCRLADSFQPAPAAFPDYIHVADVAAQAKLRHALAACVASSVNSESPQ